MAWIIKNSMMDFYKNGLSFSMFSAPPVYEKYAPHWVIACIYFTPAHAVPKDGFQLIKNVYCVFV